MTDRIAEIRGRLDKATPGEWELGVVKGDALKFCADKIASIRGTVEVLDLLALPAPSEWHQICIPGQETIIAETGCGPTSKANAALIAHAPADLAFLLGEVETLRAVYEESYRLGTQWRERAEKAERELADKGWRPIETAPKDGSHFVTARFADGGEPHYEIARYDPYYWEKYQPIGDGLYRKEMEVISEFRCDNMHRATHWMPLPTPPDSGQTEP